MACGRCGGSGWHECPTCETGGYCSCEDGYRQATEEEAALIERRLYKGAAQERKRIVAWLRQEAQCQMSMARPRPYEPDLHEERAEALELVADEIEAGEHVEGFDG